MVRSHELDSQGHLNAAVYHQYGEHARLECLRASGVLMDRMMASGVGAVQLECTIRFHRELRRDDEVDVSCILSGAKARRSGSTRSTAAPMGAWWPS